MMKLILTFSGLLNVCFIIAYGLSIKKQNKLIANTAKLVLDNIALEKIIDKDLNDYKNDQEIHKENFIKFLSDSRDWAFTYIEEVQNGLEDFVYNIEPEINYFKEYGDLTSMKPNYYSMKKIVEEYEKLKQLLPSDEETV